MLRRRRCEGRAAPPLLLTETQDISGGQVRTMKVPLIALSAFLAATLVAAEESGARSPQPAPNAPSAGGLYEIGKRLFDEYAPDEIKAEYDFVSPEAWDAFFQKLQGALQSSSVDELAAFAPAARTVLLTLQSTAAESDLLEWLRERIDLAEAADEVAHAPRLAPTPPPAPPPAADPSRAPASPPLTPSSPPDLAIPHYAVWQKRLAGRPAPVKASVLMPGLKAAFLEEGIPPELAWIAEVESSFNPNARSPVGARGLFQLMPATAESLGLSTFLPDERTHPGKSAQAAARYLRKLHARFADWPLAIAAYNAGEGRVGRALGNRRARTFAAISADLPSETQLYVPKVLATVALREGVSPHQLPAPRPRS